MRQIERVVATALAGVVVSAAAAQDAVEWRVEDGGNGHWYEWKSVPRIGYQESQTAAESAGGHLITIANAGENSFVTTIAQDIEGWSIPGTMVPWFGHFFDGETWTWVTGEPFVYTNWAPGQPDFVSSGNHFGNFSQNGLWGNHSSIPAKNPVLLGVEWSADCNGDGIVDYGQILEGTFDDLNGNGVPDCCDDGSCIPPVQWRVEDGGNGHWYSGIIVDDPIGWENTRALANSMGADLIAAEEPGEKAWMFDEFSLESRPYLYVYNGEVGPYLGARQEIEPAGPWSWVNGIEFDPSADIGCCSNDCNGIQESVLHLSTYTGGWNDAPLEPDPICVGSLIYSGIIEWSADCNGDGLVDYGQILDGTLEDTNNDGVPNVCDPCLGDITGNGVVDAADLGILLAVWNTDGKSAPEADINSDGTVNAADLGILLGAWGICP